MGQETLRLKKGDFVAGICVFAAAIVIFAVFSLGFSKKDATIVQAYQNGELLWEKPLNQDEIFEISGEYTNIVTISDGKVSFTDSDCPGQDCVHMGDATPSRPLICLPNRVEIRLVEGGKGKENDRNQEGKGQEAAREPGNYDVAVG